MAGLEKRTCLGGIELSVVGDNLSGQKFLDYGSGDGNYSKFLLNQGAFVSSVDIDNKSKDLILNGLTIEESKRFKFYCLDAEKDSFDNKLERFDSIICREVLEHIKNYEKLLSEFYNLLDSKGMLVISIPTSFTEKYFNFWDPKWLDKCEHVNIFRKKDIIALAKKHKFNLKKLGKHSFRRTIFWSIVTPFKMDHKMGKIKGEHRIVKIASFIADCICYFKWVEKIGDYLLPKSYVFYLQKKM